MDFVICSVPKFALGVPLQGPAVLKAALQQNGFSCRVFDFNDHLGQSFEKIFNGATWASLEPIFTFEETFKANQYLLKPMLSTWVDYILSCSPKCVGLSVFTHRSYFITREICRMMREKKFAGRLIIGGAHAVCCGENLLKQNLIDQYFVGAAEHALVAYARGNFTKQSLASHTLS